MHPVSSVTPYEIGYIVDTTYGVADTSLEATTAFDRYKLKIYSVSPFNITASIMIKRNKRWMKR